MNTKTIEETSGAVDNERNEMKTFTISDIRSWEPCYDPSEYLPEEWTGTAVDILRNAEIPTQDRLWVVCRTELISDKILRLFAVWCARQVQYLMTDERSIRALDVAEAYANGNACDSELCAAWEAASDASAAAMEAAARGAAYAAWAASDAARGAAYAAMEAARAAARDAASVAAMEAAAYAASDAASDAQVEKLIEMIEGAE